MVRVIQNSPNFYSIISKNDGEKQEDSPWHLLVSTYTKGCIHLHTCVHIHLCTTHTYYLILIMFLREYHDQRNLHDVLVTFLLIGGDTITKATDRRKGL